MMGRVFWNGSHREPGRVEARRGFQKKNIPELLAESKSEVDPAAGGAL